MARVVSFETTGNVGLPLRNSGHAGTSHLVPEAQIRQCPFVSISKTRLLPELEVNIASLKPWQVTVSLEKWAEIAWEKLLGISTHRPSRK